MQREKRTMNLLFAESRQSALIHLVLQRTLSRVRDDSTSGLFTTNPRRIE